MTVPVGGDIGDEVCFSFFVFFFHEHKVKMTGYEFLLESGWLIRILDVFGRIDSYGGSGADIHIWHGQSYNRGQGPGCQGWRSDGCTGGDAAPVCEHGSHAIGKLPLSK